ncbi:MAG TPA: hypothetical protein VF796_00445 [Humisphaera sp.]
MGLDLFDLLFRSERAFGVRIPRGWQERIGVRRHEDDATLATYHAFLLDLCREQGVTPPAESWQVLLSVVEAATGADPATVGPETRLVRDLAPFG